MAHRNETIFPNSAKFPLGPAKLFWIEFFFALVLGFKFPQRCFILQNTSSELKFSSTGTSFYVEEMDVV
jgi:hypothetical protein